MTLENGVEFDKMKPHLHFLLHIFTTTSCRPLYSFELSCVRCDDGFIRNRMHLFVLTYISLLLAAVPF